MKFIVKHAAETRRQNGPKGGQNWHVTTCWLCSEDPRACEPIIE